MAVLIGKNLLSLIPENKFLSADLNRQSYGQQIVHFSITQSMLINFQIQYLPNF